jgi:hypothetical protein
MYSMVMIIGKLVDVVLLVLKRKMLFLQKVRLRTGYGTLKNFRIESLLIDNVCALNIVIKRYLSRACI